MEEIVRFVTLAQTDRFTVTDLCEQFGISRKTAYKHLERYAVGGLQALQPRSHRPHSFPQRTAEAVEKLVLAERRLEPIRRGPSSHDPLRLIMTLFGSFLRQANVGGQAFPSEEKEELFTNLECSGRQ